MNIRLFNKKYWVRRFGLQKEVKGYLVSTYRDFVASLHLHPTGTDTMQANPEGLRRVKRIEGHGETALVTADETTGRKGDMVYYCGRWYECISSQMWDRTILSHYNYLFIAVSEDSAGSTDLVAPSFDPATYNPTDDEKEEEEEP